MLNSHQIKEMEEKVYTITEDLSDQHQQQQLKDLAQIMRQQYSEKDIQLFITQLTAEKKQKQQVQKERPWFFFRSQKLHSHVKYGAAACLFVYSSYVLAKFWGRRRPIKLRS